MNNDIIIVTKMRKNSKRLKNKNKLILNGKELWEHTKEIALQLGYPYYLITDYEDISTNEFQIYNPGEAYFEDVHILNKAIQELLINKNINPKHIILLQVTSPVRNIEELKNAIIEYLNQKKDCLIGGYYNKKYTYVLWNNLIIKNYNHRDYNTAEKNNCFVESGCFYIFKTEQLLKKHITDGNIMLYEFSNNEDIDTIQDYERVKKIYEN